MNLMTTAAATVCAGSLLVAACATQRPATAERALAGSVQAAPAASAATDAAGERIVARYTSGSISAAALEARAAGPLLSSRQRVFEVQSAILEGIVFDQLVENAARAAGLSVDAFLGAEVERDLPPPDDDRIAEILTQYRAQLSPDDTEARAQVVSFLLREERRTRLDTLRNRLFAAAGVELFLDPPRAAVPIRPFNPARGAAEAAVTIVEFSDFQCPFCRQVQPLVDDLLSRYPNRVKLIFKHFPLSSHSEARTAARAALCAGGEGKFWEYHDLLFEHEADLDDGSLVSLAERTGLDTLRFAECLAAGSSQAELEQDLADGAALGIDGTPRFFVNGRILEGAQPLEAFTAVIDDELRRIGSQAAAP